MAHLTDAVRQRTRAQRSMITRRELLTLDVTDDQIRQWVRNGCLERLERAVYIVGGAEVRPAARITAAVERAGPGARAGGISALGLWDLDGFSLVEEDAVHQPVVIVPSNRRLQNVAFDWFAVDLPEHVCAEVDGIPTVTVPEGLVQAGDSVTRKCLRTGFDDAVRRDLATGREVEQAVRRLDGVLEGAGLVAQLIASGTLQLESEGERELGNLFGPEDPQPLWQVWIGGYRVDALFAEARLVLEYHGKRYHRSEQDRRADRVRAAKLRADHGIEILEVTAADLANPVALRERILGRRAERLRAGTSPLRDHQVAKR